MGDFKRTYLKTSDNNGNEYKRNSVLEFVLKSLWIILKFFLLYLVLRLLLIGVIKTTNIGTENRVNLNNIPAPIQTSATGSVTKAINDGNAQITYVAEYKINGRVVDVERYSSNHVRDNLSSRDIALGWGVLSTDESKNKIKWTSIGNRYLSWRTSDNEWYQKVGGESVIINSHSNNHLIPSNNEIKRKIESISRGDYVQLEGYLVDVYWTNPKGNYFKWNTSISRGDTGNGACEIIYVTDIKWLR